MDVYYSFNYLSSGWMILEALPLIASPTIIITMLSPDVRESTPLEQYLSRSLGLALIAFAVMNLLLTGSVPLTSSLADGAKGTTTEATDPTAPYALPSLTIALTYHIAVTFYCYSQWQEGLSTAFIIPVLVHGLFVTVGGWVLMFGASEGHISRKTGADKRTSGFPFKNVEADKRKGKKN